MTVESLAMSTVKLSEDQVKIFIRIIQSSSAIDRNISSAFKFPLIVRRMQFIAGKVLRNL